MTSPSARHKPMADFAFYKDVYFGSLIPERAFYGLALQAKAVLEYFRRIYQVEVPGEDSLKMAVCAMAEVLHAYGKHRGGVVAASAGEVSVRYAQNGHTDRQLQRELYEKASIYLDIYRGVGA